MLRPRISRPARLNLDFIGASIPDTAPPVLASVDQVDPSGAVSPVSGWLLPDHLDGSLEVYDESANLLGMLLEDLNGNVVWEGAPGIPGPLGAPPAPFVAGDQAARHVVRFAAGMVAADAAAAAATPPGSPRESALAALLRVVDTTAWSVDPLGSIGTEHPSSLVGRPIAVLRMAVSIEIDSDINSVPPQLNLGQTAMSVRQAAYDLLSSRVITVRIGELTRTDDGALGYFIGDDYGLFTPVSPEVLQQARVSGRMQGQLGVLGQQTVTPPPPAPLTHPYVDGNETPLQVRPGQTVELTVLMAPGGAVHATSGLLPRVRTALARDWISDALKHLLPTFRVGPLLVDPTTVRVPKVTGLPKQQVFTRRNNPSTWEDDQIAVATQDALLPDQPAVVREGWLRVASPSSSSETSSGSSSG
jgi:hypothetical protein